MFCNNNSIWIVLILILLFGCNGFGSGCGCSASVLAGHILPAMRDGVWKRVLFAATGALLSPTSAQQGSSIPGICHALVLEKED